MEAPTIENQLKLKWYHFILAFFAGLFLVNILPHLFAGITGHKFPTPFANPPGVGLSTPILNVTWSLINAVLGFICLYFSKVRQHKKVVLTGTFIVGCVLMAYNLAVHFGSVFNP